MISLDSYSLSDALHEALNTPPDREFVKQDYEGNDYLPGWYVFHQANAIFGPAGWSYETVSLPEVCDEGNTSKGKPYVSFIAIVRVTVRLTCITDQGEHKEVEVVHEDVGQSRQIADGRFGAAAKGSITDGVKRCLRAFGPAFGNDLYRKGPSRN